MDKSFIRKSTIFGTALAITALFAGCSGSADTEGSSDGVESITFSVWDTGMTGAIPKALAENTEIQEEYGVDVSVRATPNLSEVYSNLLTGEANANIGAPESFASMNDQGAEIEISSLVAPNTTSVIGQSQGDLGEELRGKRLAAISASGGWIVLERAIEDTYGLTSGDDYEVISIPNTLSGAAQVAAGTADFVMGWEPAVTQTLDKHEDQQVVASPDDLSIDTSEQFVLGVSSEISDETVDRLLDALNATVDDLREDSELADEYGEQQGYTDDTVSTVLESGALPIDARPLDDASKESILSDLKLVFEAGDLQEEPSSSIFRGE